jgi:hypothetical protein
VYLLRAGCSWRLPPHDFPPWQTVYYHLRRWEREAVWTRVHHTLVMTDTDGRLLAVEVHAADIQDRDSAKGVLKRSRRSFPFVETVFAPLGDAVHRLPGNGMAAMPDASSNGPETRPMSALRLFVECHG